MSMTETAHTRILKACYAALVPIARLLLRAGVNFREFNDLARLAFVTVASDEYGLRGRPTNSSRISAMTGIPRKEVSRIRAERPILEQLPRTELSPLGDILHRWHTDPLYLDEKGVPLPIPVDGPAPSFFELARECARDVPVGAIKVELVRIGAIFEHQDGRLRVLKRAAVPEAVDDRLITSLSFNLFCLASTIAYNSNPQRKTEGRIERFVQSDELTEDAKAQLRVLTRRRIERFTEELDEFFTAVASDGSSGEGRVGVGVYYFEDD